MAEEGLRIEGIERAIGKLYNLRDNVKVTSKELLEGAAREIVNRAKQDGNYKDRTGALRNGINNKEMEDGLSQLISTSVFYGIHVENKGYKVLTFAIEEFKPNLSKLFAKGFKSARIV